MCYHGDATAWGFTHVSLRAFGGRSDRLRLSGAVFCGRCEAENGNVQIRRGRPETARRGAQRLPQEVHGESGRSARPKACRSGRRAQAMKRDPEKGMPVFRLREALGNHRAFGLKLRRAKAGRTRSCANDKTKSKWHNAMLI